MFFIICSSVSFYLVGEPMRVQMIPIPQTEKRADGMLKVDLNTIPVPSDFFNRYQLMISIPPMRFGGNHKHPRREIFICLSDDVELHWVDEEGKTQVCKMKEDQQLYLFDVPPYVPHAIINLSLSAPAVILELAEEKQHDVEPCSIL